MTCYAIEICDRWDHWHVAKDAYTSSLMVFASKKEAFDQLTIWRSQEKGLVKQGVEWAGIMYGVRPFREDRVEIRKRAKPLQERKKK